MTLEGAIAPFLLGAVTASIAGRYHLIQRQLLRLAGERDDLTWRQLLRISVHLQ